MMYICAQPETKYYAWQVDTMIHSFLQNGVKQKDIVVLLGKDNRNSFVKVRLKYPKVNYYRYSVERFSYAPAIKPYLMWQYFKDNPQREQYFYSDCDIVLTKPLNNFDQNYVYCSNTISYIGHDYIISKGEDVLDLMCDTLDIDKELVKSNQAVSGGCQFVFNTLPSSVWKNAYRGSLRLYRELDNYNKQNAVEQGYPIQQWTAEMWATLWEIWKAGYETKVDDELAFSWSTDKIHTLKQTKILHNAGVSNQKGLFKKFKYTQKFPSKDLQIDDEYCSNYYYKKVKEALYD